jgi:hypothetical protein
VTDVLDVGPVNVTGAVRGQRVRIVWADGTLHVVRSAARIDRFPMGAPVVDGHYWRFRTDEGKTVMATKRGCSG